MLRDDGEERRKLRGRGVAYVAQSAAAAFNPAIRLIDQVCEAPIRHGVLSPAEAREAAVSLFRQLELPDPETIGARYPHEVSGGQSQRSMAAMAMRRGPTWWCSTNRPRRSTSPRRSNASRRSGR